MQEQNNSTCTYLFGLLLTLLALLKYHLHRHLQLRITTLRKRTSLDLDQHKVIIAIEPLNLLFKTTNYCTPGYHEVVLPRKGWDWLWTRFMRLFGRGIFYCPKESKKNIHSFLKNLTANPSIQLFLYTTLSLQVAELILTQMDLLHFFPEQLRRSCDDITCESTKHPIEVDILTKRVVIVTSIRNDHLQEDSKYFLVVRGQEWTLGKVRRTLERLVDNNEDIDELHNELAFVKADIQSEGEFQ